MEAKFKVGDTVRLKSGSPKMTISENKMSISVSGEVMTFTGYVRCTWFNDDKLMDASFDQDTLDLDE